MISEDSLPTKSRSLRAKSIAKRLATEKNQNGNSASNSKATKRSSNSSSKHHTMSKYRRKVANAKERERMKLVSEAFDKLSSVVPVYKMMTASSPNIGPSPQQISQQNEDQNKNPVTKVSTLRCAIAYINSLQKLIEDANRGVLDPSLYTLPEEEEMQTKITENPKKKAKKVKDSSRKKKKNEVKKSGGGRKENAMKKGKNGSFKVRQYHASDFSARLKKPMSKAQLNLAIAKGLQNCKPIYAPPPSVKKLTPISNPGIPMQLIQLKPVNEDSQDCNLEVFLSSSPSTSSLMASSPNSSTSSLDSPFSNNILEEPHILDDIQAVLMDADNFDILV